MKPTILSVAYPFAVVGPGAVGGAEQVLTSLEAELVSQGYRSVVVAREGSLPAGRLLPTNVPVGVITEEVRQRVTRAHQANIDLALANCAIDLVHLHGIDFHRYMFPEDVPVLVTLHLPPSWYPEEIWDLPSNYQLQCVSETQSFACPAEVREHLPVVGNGVALSQTDLLPKRRSYAVMLSRICPEKNLHAGIDAARLAGIPVLLAGEAFPYEEHLRYLREEIEPRLGDGARMLGPITGADKTRLLARARCLLLPTVAPETSSLVAMEALAVGTPVIAYRSGAIPEIVEDGRTGFLVDSIAGMVAAIARIGEIDNAECSEIAAWRFPLSRMVQNYRNLYRRMIDKQPRDPRSCMASASTKSGNLPEIREDRAKADEASLTLTLSILETLGALEALAPEWADLWRADRLATPFQSPAWLIPWWKHVGEGELFTLAARDSDGRLVGLLPMYIYTQPADGRRDLLLLGAGTSDYLDGLFDGDAGPEAGRIAGAILRELEGYEGCWDRGFLHQLRQESQLLACARAMGSDVFASEPCSSVAVEGWFRLPAKIRLNSGRYRRRAEARGSFRYITAATQAEAQKGLEDLIALHARRWQDDGVLTPPAVQRHHRESVPGLLAAGLLRMLSLEIDTRTIAVLYSLIDPPEPAGVAPRGRRLYSYLIGFDPEFGDLSPGTLLLSYAYDRCEAEGIARLDMLRGGEGYKQLWGAVSEPTFGVSLAVGTGQGVRSLASDI